MRILFAAAVVAGSVKGCSESQVSTCDSIMDRADAPAWCVQNKGSVFVGISAFDRQPDKYFAAAYAGTTRDGFYTGPIAPHSGPITSEQLGGWDWLCLSQLDLAAGMTDLRFRDPSQQDYVLMHTAEGPKPFVCFH